MVAPLHIIKKETLEEGCIKVSLTCRSSAMGREIAVVMLLPSYYDKRDNEDGRSFPILFGLHGMDAPFQTYSEMPPMRTGVEEKGILLCCFDADAASWYLDAKHELEGREQGVRVRSLFSTFFFDELMPFLDAHFKIRSDAKMITGFSMGSYGALKFMLDKPQMFVSVSALSTSVFNFDERLLSGQESRMRSLTDIFGPFEDEACAEEYRNQSLGHRFTSLNAHDAASISSQIYIRTGVDDSLIEGTRRLHDILQQRHIEHSYQEGAGAHDWAFWLAISADAFRFHWRSLEEKPDEHLPL